ncbi:hypothetical protein [Iamia sp.]|uniref:hypothetical protein n=1 Tax=Iamia sp. TaxID=2722710 RepID=UPI002BB6883F|nr:hypothetical protein [Iamia sp.]HXH57726.1 hypothetical protein [Iamia sp.]
MDLVHIKHPKLNEGDNEAFVHAGLAEILCRDSGWRPVGKDDKAAIDNITPPAPAG